jgi:hypothetical protein
MTEIEKKDKILSFLDKNRIIEYDYKKISQLIPEFEMLSEHEILLLCHDLKKDHFITFEGMSVSWSKNGSEMIKNGGYIALEKLQNEKQYEEKKFIKKQNENILLDNKNKRWQFSTRWLILVIAIIGLAFTLIKLFSTK